MVNLFTLTQMECKPVCMSKCCSAGRVDDVINVSGHRIGTAEVESALVNHPACAEAAVVPVEHPIKGQGIYAFITLMDVRYTSLPSMSSSSWKVRCKSMPPASSACQCRSLQITALSVPGDCQPDLHMCELLLYAASCYCIRGSCHERCQPWILSCVHACQFLPPKVICGLLCPTSQ